MAGSIAGHKKPSQPSEGLLQWRSFDLADAMEQGLAREVTTSYITPPPQDVPSKHLIVKRSEDNSEHILATEDGEALLMSRRSKDKSRVDIYIPGGGDPPVALGPAFTLREDCGNSPGRKNCGDHEDAPRTFTLWSERCDCCRYLSAAQKCSGCGPGRRELAKIWQQKEELGPAKIMCMEVDLPELCADGTPTIWCTRTGGANAAQSRIELESRRPKWNQRIRSLTLDFYGRCSQASAKNFQLMLKGRDEGEIKEADLLFGKIADNTFVLDYKHPLSMAQAFAIALSTNQWQ